MATLLVDKNGRVAFRKEGSLDGRGIPARGRQIDNATQPELINMANTRSIVMIALLFVAAYFELRLAGCRVCSHYEEG